MNTTVESTSNAPIEAEIPLMVAVREAAQALMQIAQSGEVTAGGFSIRWEWNK
jgi:hypothetical protein